MGMFIGIGIGLVLGIIIGAYAKDDIMDIIRKDRG